MAMKKTFDAVYAGEKYTDREGNEKTRYINIGALFTRDDGSLTAKIESIPVGFNGWVNFYEPKEREGGQAGGGSGGSRGAPSRERPTRAGSPPPNEFESDEIPFVSNRGVW